MRGTYEALEKPASQLWLGKSRDLTPAHTALLLNPVTRIAQHDAGLQLDALGNIRLGLGCIAKLPPRQSSHIVCRSHMGRLCLRRGVVGD